MTDINHPVTELDHHLTATNARTAVCTGLGLQRDMWSVLRCAVLLAAVLSQISIAAAARGHNMRSSRGLLPLADSAGSAAAAMLRARSARALAEADAGESEGHPHEHGPFICRWVHVPPACMSA